MVQKCFFAHHTLQGKLNTMQFITNVPCPKGTLHFLLVDFKELLVLRSNIFADPL